MTNAVKIYGAMTFTLLFWASAFVSIRVGLTSYSPGALALLRFMVASICMAVIYYFLPHKPRLPWQTRLQLLVIGVGGIGLYNICLNIGEVSVTAGVASFVIGFVPVITILLSIVFLHERPHYVVWIGIAISFIGLLLLVMRENIAAPINHGVLIILISALMGGLYNFSQRRYLCYYHPIIVTAWVMWGGTLALLIFTPDLSHELFNASIKATAIAIYMGVFPAALAYVAWCYVLHHWAASKASLYLYFLPLLSTLLGALFLHEYPAKLSLLGGTTALVGALIAAQARKY